MCPPTFSCSPVGASTALTRPTAGCSVAAVAGRHVRFELFQERRASEPRTCSTPIDEAERAGIIVTERAGAEAEFWFAHELIRQTPSHPAAFPAAASPPAGGRSPGKLPAATPTCRPRRSPPTSPNPARPPTRPKLFRYLVLAGGRALLSAAFGDALRHLRRAAGVGGHDADPTTHAEMLLHLGLAERAVGEADVALGREAGPSILSTRSTVTSPPLPS